MDALTIRIVTPDALIYEGRAKKLQLQGLTDAFTLLPRHAPMVELLDAGEIKITGVDDDVFYIGITGGLLEVADNIVNVISSSATRTEVAGIALNQIKQEQKARRDEIDKKRIQLIKSEMELYRLLREANTR